jgi:hypothetical protein
MIFQAQPYHYLQTSEKENLLHLFSQIQEILNQASVLLIEQEFLPFLKGKHTYS